MSDGEDGPRPAPGALLGAAGTGLGAVLVALALALGGVVLVVWLAAGPPARWVAALPLLVDLGSGLLIAAGGVLVLRSGSWDGDPERLARLTRVHTPTAAVRALATRLGVARVLLFGTLVGRFFTEDLGIAVLTAIAGGVAYELVSYVLMLGPSARTRRAARAALTRVQAPGPASA